MTDHQPNLLKNVESRQVSSPHAQTGGPVFEFGPGWGAKTNKWLKKYVLASDCSLCRHTRYILLAGIIILIISWPQFRKTSHQQPQNSLTGQIKIAEVVQTGDSKIKLARRALANYLTQLPDNTLTNGQKIFIETVLGHNIASDTFHAGVNIEIAADDIKATIEKSRSLTPSQLQRWEDSAKNIKL